MYNCMFNIQTIGTANSCMVQTLATYLVLEDAVPILFPFYLYKDNTVCIVVKNFLFSKIYLLESAGKFWTTFSRLILVCTYLCLTYFLSLLVYSEMN